MAATPLSFGSVSGVGFSGLATGLNTAQIISALVAVESQAIKTPLLNKKSILSIKLDALSVLESKLSALQSKVNSINTTATFLANTATSSDSTYLTATADGSAVAGPHTVTVSELARSETETHAPPADITSASATIGTGTFTITYAGGTPTVLTISSGEDTLNGLASKINSAGLDVTASVVDTGTPAAHKYKLVLTGKDTGAANTISVSHTLSGGSFDLGAFSDLLAARDAKFTVDGIVDIKRATNTISDVTPGVTYNLLKDGSPSLTVTVSKDTSKIKAKIDDFVAAYNDVRSYIKTQQTYKQGTALNPLFGDSTLGIITTKLSGIISGVQNTGTPAYANLAQIGITSATDGTLKVDSSKLEAAINADPQSVGKLFATGLTGGGVAVQIKSWLDTFLSSSNGVILAQKNGINDTITKLNAQIVKADDRLTKLTDQLTKNFTNLEVVVGKLQAQSNFLSSAQFGLG